MRRIASMAETYDVALAPHCPLGPIALAACIQVALNAPNCEYDSHVTGFLASYTALIVQSYDPGDELGDTLQRWRRPFHIPRIREGVRGRGRAHCSTSRFAIPIRCPFLAPAECLVVAPGLGIEINETLVREAAAANPEAWRNPVWRNVDGGIAEW